MGWNGLALVTDADLGAIEPEATHSLRPWGAATWPKARTEAKRDLKIWLERDFAKVPAVTDRILDRWTPDWVYRFTGGTYTDVTTGARDDNEEDVPLATAFTTFGTDRIYLGALYEFEGLALKLLDHLNAIASVLTVKYWAPTGWLSLGAGDGTSVSGKTFGQTGRVLWTPPTDWERRRFNGTAEEFYWVELSVSAALTAGTAASQILAVRAPDGLKRVAAYLALGHILRGLAAAAATPEAWLSRVTNDRRTGYHDQAVDLYTQLRDNGGIPLDVNLNEAIEKQERQVTQPLRMRRG